MHTNALQVMNKDIIAFLLPKAKHCKQFNCPLVIERIKTLLYTHVLEAITTMKMNALYWNAKIGMIIHIETKC